MMTTREERIASLAATLKSSGMARSDSQARMMAEEMVGVEDNVQKRFDSEHQKAQEFLSTTKNLGTPRVQAKPQAPPIAPRNQDNVLVKPLGAKPVDESIHEKKVQLEEAHTDVNLGKGSLKDLMLGQIAAEHADLTPLEDQYEKMQAERAAAKDAPTAPAAPVVQSIPEANIVEETPLPTPEPAPAAAPAPEHEETPKENVVLDSEKLTKMMEEDGPLEEHTREIKEKPKNVKPKDAYEEDKVDLSNMFNFGKRSG